MTRHLLIYDVDWWVLGKHAKVVQQHHPYLDLMSSPELNTYIHNHGYAALNRSYDVISTMCLGIAGYALSKNIRVDSSAAVSYYYFSKNYDTFREWQDPIIPDTDFIRLVVGRIGKIGAINPKLFRILKDLVPDCRVEYMRQFVDIELFKPLVKKHTKKPFVVGWVGHDGKPCKNYYTLLEDIKAHFLQDARVKFVEALTWAFEDMPIFYNSLDLLLLTSANEGGGAPALEAYACGIPVLGTNVGYVKEAAHPDAKQWIIDSDDPSAFIERIEACLENEEALLELGKQCRDHTVTYCAIENNVNDWLNTLFDITKK